MYLDIPGSVQLSAIPSQLLASHHLFLPILANFLPLFLSVHASSSVCLLHLHKSTLHAKCVMA